MVVYGTTLDSITRQLDKALPTSPSTSVTNNYADYTALVTELIGQCTQWLEDYTGRYVVPRLETRKTYWRDVALRKRMARSELILDQDLVSCTSITSGGSVVSATEYALLSVGTTTHYERVLFNSLTGDGSFDDSIDILGTWGYSQELDTLESSAGQLSATATTLGKTASGYEAYQYLKMNDEHMLITAVNTSSLTLRRGQLGTTAVIQPTGTAMRIFKQHASVQLCLNRMVAWLYQKRTDVGDVVQIADGATIISQAPAIVKQTANLLRRYDLGAV